MPGQPIHLAVTAAVFAGLDPDDYPDGQRATVTDDGEKEYEARGADGARTWVLLHGGHVDDHEAAVDPHPTYLTQAEADALYLTGAEAPLHVVAETGESTYVLVEGASTPPPENIWTEDSSDWVYTET